MRRRGWLAAAFLPALLAGHVPTSVAASPAAKSPSTAVSLCPPATPTADPTPAGPIRFGIDPGLAGNPLPSLNGPVPINRRGEREALHALKPKHRGLVIRLNRLFWSGGDTLLHTFAREARSYARQGYDVEVQVRYHPTTANNGNLDGWSRWVRHVVDVLGKNKALTSLTITNEVNLAISPNTSDGSFKAGKGALVHGVEAAYDELRAHHWAHRVLVGFTFAYRLDPTADARLFEFLASNGGAKLRAALGFVGLDAYPGTVYPPALVPPVDTAETEMASAIATMRTCYLPLAKIPPTTPLWVTENGFPSNGSSNTSQSSALRGMVDAVHEYGGSYNVTNYRWFNLRDNSSRGSGLFDQDGLLRDDDVRKPSFALYKSLIEKYGAR
ncbi:MAG TPA: hypothetical protein VHC43_02790 [Mycobacteriales bacterium]|nr:hypothetical protein [Mycobacteriales bacterium]